MPPLHRDPTLPASLQRRVLERLGFSAPPATDLTGLRALYLAWCTHVPFDNVQKMIALRTGRPGALPGTQPVELFEGWLAHGTGGTCWTTSGALHALTVSLGFDARRVAGSIRDMDILNHGSVKVRIDGRDWLIDSSLMTNAPLPLGPGVHVHDDPVFRTEVEFDGAQHLFWFDVPPHPTSIPCRLLRDPADNPFCAARYEASREKSPFNQRLYARRNGFDELVVIVGHTRHARTRDGTSSRELDAPGLRAALIDDIGLSEEIVDRWAATGSLEASFEEPAGPPPPPETRLPPSRRPV